MLRRLLALVLLFIPFSLAIIGGSFTELDEYPFQVSLTSYFDLDSMNCGGTIISDRHILTAAHCVVEQFGAWAEWIVVEAGFEEYDVSTFSTHPMYDAGKPGIFHDIAILRLEEPIQFSSWLQPVTLSRMSVLSGEAVAIGRGDFTKGNSRDLIDNEAGILLQVKVPLVEQRTCRRIWWAAARILSSQICAGGRNRGIYNGDSGGPLLIRDQSSERWLQIGIMSYASLYHFFDQHLVPAVFTRISSFCDFIEQTTNGAAKCI